MHAPLGPRTVAETCSRPLLFTLPADFVQVPIPRLQMSLVRQSNLGTREASVVTIVDLFMHREFATDWEMRFLDSEGGATFVSVGRSEVEAVVKEELCCYPKIGRTGRLSGPWGNSDFRFMIPVLTALAERGLVAEQPMFWIRTDEGHSFYGVRKIDGIPLSQALQQVQEGAAWFAYLTGQG